MTTTVTVTAHCDPETTEVSVHITDANGESNEILQDGESKDFHAYDARVIAISEIAKMKDDADS